jgi:hypothetical protein
MLLLNWRGLMAKKAVKKKKFFQKVLSFRNGLLIDIFSVIFFGAISLLYLGSFLGDADRSNDFSAPLLPFLSKLVSLLTGLEELKALTFWLVFFLSLGPIFLYFFTSKLTGRRSTGFFSSLVYCLPGSWFASGRASMAFLIGDGGHLAALSLVPLVAMFLLDFLRKGVFKNLVFSSLGMVLVGLLSPFGFLTGGVIVTAVTFSEMLQGEGRLKTLRFIFFLAVGAGLVAFWYNPVFVLSLFGGAKGAVVRRTLWNLIPISFVVVPVLAAFGFLLFEKRAHLQPLFIALGLVVLFSLLAFADYVGDLFPGHPRRYLPEFGFSLAFLAGILVSAFSDYLRFKGKFYKVKLSPLGRSLARKAFWVSSLGAMGVAIIVSLGSVWELPETQVLGLWDDGGKGAIWALRSQTGRASGIFGYLVTFLTGSLLFLVWQKIKKQGRADEGAA